MKRLTWRDKAIYSVIFSMLGSFLTVTKTFNNQPGSPSVYLEGINLSAARSTPNKLRPRDERLVGCRYGNRQLDIASTFNYDVLPRY